MVLPGLVQRALISGVFIGVLALLVFVPVGTAPPPSGEVRTGESTSSTTKSLPGEFEGQPGQMLVLDAAGTRAGLFVLEYVDGYLMSQQHSPTRLDGEFVPPVSFRAKFEGRGWAVVMSVMEIELEYRTPTAGGYSLVVTEEADTYFGHSGYCEIEILDAVVDEYGFPGEGFLYLVEQITGRVACSGLSEVRSGRPLEFDALFRLDRSPPYSP